MITRVSGSSRTRSQIARVEGHVVRESLLELALAQLGRRVVATAGLQVRDHRVVAVRTVDRAGAYRLIEADAVVQP